MEQLLNNAITLTLLIAIALVVQCTQGAELRVRRDDKTKLKVTSIKEPPYLTVKTSGKGNDRFEGYIPELMEKIAAKAGLKYELHLVKDGVYGAQLPNGSWNGMIGELVRQDADLAAAPITISDERKKVVAFTRPIMTFTTTILIKKPADGEQPPINSVQALADQTAIKYGIIKDGMTQDFFKKSTNPTYQKMWRYMESNPENLQDNMSDGIAKVRSSNGKYAFIMETPMAEYWMNQPPCDLQQLDNLQKDYHYGFATAKNAAFLQRVNNAIESLKASNELTKLKDKWWKSDKTCQSSASKVNYVSSYFTIAFVVAFNSFVVRLA